MLKTIRKFVVERRGLVRQRRQQVIGEANSDDPSRHSEVQQREGDYNDSSRHSKVPPQVAEPQPDEPAAPTVWGKLKWYNRVKGYGFVELSDGSGDAFLHASALAGISVDALQPGVTIEFRTAPAQRGVQVTEVISVDSSPAQTAPKEFKIAIRPTALGGQRPRDGDGEVVQRRQGVRFHRPGRRREGRLRACLSTSASGHHEFERGPAGLCRRY
jgi:cold shock CspA family protein